MNPERRNFMKNKKLILSLLTAGVVSLFAGTADATTVTKLLTGDYVGQTVSVQGKLTEHLGGPYYQLIDYTGEHIRVNLGNMGFVDGNRDLTVEGKLVISDNVLTLDATKVNYDQDRVNDATTPVVRIKDLLSSDKYHGQQVALEGRVTEYLGGDYANFVDKKGERVILKLNGYHLPEGDNVKVYGVPGFANNRLEFSVSHFD